MTQTFRLAATLAMISLPALASAQVNFPKDLYYLAFGDSVAAGEGAMPVTNGYVYQLYEQGTFGQKQRMEFANSAIRGARSWELREQVAQALCAAPARRPTVVTITAGANDFLRGDRDIISIAFRVTGAINLLLNNGSPIAGPPVLDPVTGQPCHPLTNVTILVSNYYRIPHPVPAIAQVLDDALSGFDQVLRIGLRLFPVPQGSRVAIVDLYAASEGRQGLVTIERRLGFSGPFDYDIHPTNLGHSFIAREFEAVWQGLP